MSTRSYGSISFETSNEDKVLFPAGSDSPVITKGEVIDYYERVADAMLPHLKDRPLAMHRWPDGIEEKGFYHKQVPDHFPDWIQRVSVSKKEGGQQELVVCDKQATLAYLADQACLTPHMWLSRTDELDRPDQLIVDLDPSDDSFESVRNAAKHCRDLLDELDLPAFVKTTGSRGVHVTVPLDRSWDFDAVRSTAQRMMRVLTSRHPGELTNEHRKNKRGNRVFLDVARNAYAQTAVAPYALRAKPGAPVATPITWDELGDSSLHAQTYTISNVLRRLGQRDDPWKGMARRAVSLQSASERLADLEKGARVH